MKILVIEDEIAVAQTLELLLSHYNYAVDIAADGEMGLQMTDAFEYDLVLLDVGLPKLDGINLCQQLRAKRFSAPILLLTARGGAHQKAIALNAGADDYVVKPFDAEELIARVQALLRRGGATTPPILTWDSLSVDPSCSQVTYGSQVLALTPKEYAIVELLVRHPQKVFSARAILERAWNSIEFPGEESVRGHIKELRRKLTGVGAPKDWIQTVHGVGYRLNPLYGSLLDASEDRSASDPQIVALKAENDELRSTIDKLERQITELKTELAKRDRIVGNQG